MATGGYPLTRKIRMIVTGKTGTGKSCTANSILGEERFIYSISFSSLTAHSSFGKTTRNRLEIQVTDSPGTFDTTRPKEEIQEEIARGVALITPGPHAILIVIRVGRFTDEEYQSYLQLKDLFGPEMVRYTFLIFTGMDEVLRANQSLDSLLQLNTSENLKLLLNDVNGRYMGFDNTVIMKKRIQQGDRLIDLVVQNVERNHGQFFTCNVIYRFEQAMKEEAEKRMQAKLEAEQKQKQEENEKKERERMQTALTEMKLELQESQKRQRELEEINKAEKQKLMDEMEKFRREVYEKERSKMQKEIADRSKSDTILAVAKHVCEAAVGILPELFKMIVNLKIVKSASSLKSAPKLAITSGNEKGVPKSSVNLEEVD